MMSPHRRNTRRMTLKHYGLYMAEVMGRDSQWGEPFMPPAPTNIRDGYQEYSYHRHPEGTVRKSYESTVEEGTDNTPSPNRDMGYQEYREYFTYEVEKICDVQDTHELREWLRGCDKYGFPTVYYG